MKAMINLKKYMRMHLCFCHHEEAKGLALFGIHRFLCSRCTGISLGAVLAVAIYYGGVQIRFTTGCLMMLPLIADGYLQILRVHRSSNPFRLLSGVLFGLALNMMGLIR